MEQYGDVVNCGFNIHLISHPDLARHCFNRDFKNYERSDLVSKRMRVMLGAGLLSCNGATWVTHRKIIQPYFTKEGVKMMMPGVLETIDRYLKRWEMHAQSGAPLNLTEECSNLALLLTARAFFNADLSDQAGRISHLLETGAQYIINRSPVFIPFWIPTPGHLRLHRINRELDDRLIKTILSACTGAPEAKNIGAALINAFGEGPGNPAAIVPISDEIRTLMVAGASTLAAAMATCWYLLGQYPEHLDALYDEAAAHVPLNPAVLPDMADAFPRTTQLILESLRLYPAAYSVWRKCVVEDRVDGYVIPAGAAVMTSLFNIHRRPDCWKNPDRFDPSRFDPEHVSNRPRHHFMPFGWGPRKCIGDTFSLWVLPLVLVRMAQKFRVHVRPEQPLRLRHSIAIIPERVEATLELNI